MISNGLAAVILGKKTNGFILQLALIPVPCIRLCWKNQASAIIRLHSREAND